MPRLRYCPGFIFFSYQLINGSVYTKSIHALAAVEWSVVDQGPSCSGMVSGGSRA